MTRIFAATPEELAQEERRWRAEKRAERMVSRLPLVLQAGPNIRTIFVAMAEEFAMMERVTRSLLESRWYKLALDFKVGDALETKADSDLGLIGSLFHLALRTDESGDDFRWRIEKWISIHRRGLTTARSILELVALVYAAEKNQDIRVDEASAVAEFRVPGRTDPIRIELIDNPSRWVKARFPGVTAGQEIVIANKGLETASVRVEIKAVSGDVSNPILSDENGKKILFPGTIKKGETQVQPPLVGDVSKTDANKSNNALRSLPIGETRWEYSSNGTETVDIEVSWTEISAATCELRIPLGYMPPRYLKAAKTSPKMSAEELEKVAVIAFYRDLQGALEYGRAAGVEAILGLSWTLEKETVTMVEGPLGMSMEMAFAEEQRATDTLVSVGSRTAMQEPVDTKDELMFGGIYDATRFDNSIYE